MHVSQFVSKIKQSYFRTTQDVQEKRLGVKNCHLRRFARDPTYRQQLITAVESAIKKVEREGLYLTKSKFNDNRFTEALESTFSYYYQI